MPSDPATRDPDKLHLVSHALCPYVQRAVIALAEKKAPFIRTDIDLANKPAWFLAVSPLGRTPVLMVGPHAIFESAVVLEYLEDTLAPALHPGDPLERARHRSFIAFASAILDNIAGFYGAADATRFDAAAKALGDKFARLEAELGDGPYFAGERFSLVDAAMGPVMRYFDVFDRIADFGILAGTPKLGRWRHALSERPSVRDAVATGYDDALRDFLLRRRSHISTLMQADAAPSAA